MKEIFSQEKKETNRQMIERYYRCFVDEMWSKEEFKSFTAWAEVDYRKRRPKSKSKSMRLGGRTAYIRWFVEELIKPLSKLVIKHEELLLDTNVINFLTAPALKDTPKLRKKYPFLMYKDKLLSRQTLLEDVIDIEKIKREKLFDEEFTEVRYKEKFREFWAEFEKDPSELGHVARYDHLAELWKYIYHRNYVPNDESEGQDPEVARADLIFKLQRELNDLKKSLAEFEKESIKLISQSMNEAQKKITSLDYIIEQYNNIT